MVLLLMIAVATALPAQTVAGTQIVGKSNLELRIFPGKLDRGIPKSFTFIFVNRSDHQLRMPRPTQCIGGNGTVILRSKFTPLKTGGVPSGGGGGCGGGAEKIQILQRVQSWHSLGPGESLSINYSRRDLFDFQEDPGDYEFWGEYVPPKLTTEDISLLKTADIDFPRVTLTSAHLNFKRLN